MLKKIIAVSLALLPTLVFAKTNVFVYPSEIDNDFRMEVMKFIKSKVKVLGKKDVAIFINDGNSNVCELKGQGHKRRNLSNFSRSSSSSECKSSLNSIKLKTKSKNATTNLNIPEITDIVLNYLNNQEEFQIFYFGSPVFSDSVTGIDFSNGYPSLGHLEKASKFLSPFSINNRFTSKTEQKIHFLYPKKEEDKFLTLSQKGALFHQIKVKYFWNEFFKSRNLKLTSFNPIKQGESRRSIKIDLDSEYNKTKGSVFFVDLAKTIDMNRYKPGEKEVIIDSLVGGGTKSNYEYILMKKGQIDNIFITEEDADSDQNLGIKLKIIAINSAGAPNVQYVTPSENNKKKSHTVKFKTTDDTVSIAMYPIDSNGNAHDFGGYWGVSNLTVAFK